MAAIHLQTLPDREEQLHLMQEDARYDVADDGDKDHTCIPTPLFSPISPPGRHRPKYRRYSFPTTAPSTAPIAAAAAATRGATATATSPVRWRKWP